jgi:pimeloyl-ACP methyl ester carboxylesterase
MWPLFDAIKAPILVIRGAESETLLASTVAKMVSRGSGIRAVEIPGVGHTPWLSEPEALQALSQFCADEDRGAEADSASGMLSLCLREPRRVPDDAAL